MSEVWKCVDLPNPFAGAQPPADGSKWEEWESRTQFIAPILQVLEEQQLPVVCVIIAGLKGMGKSAVVNLAIHLFRLKKMPRSCIFMRDFDLNDKLSDKLVATVSGILIGYCRIKRDSIDISQSISLLNEMAKQANKKGIRNMVLVLEKVGERLEFTVKRSSDEIVAPPYPIGDDDKRRTRGLPSDSPSPPQISYNIVAENIEDYGHKYQLEITAESSALQVPILYFTQPVGPLRVAEVDRWLEVKGNKIQPLTNGQYWELDETPRHCSHRENFSLIKACAGRYPPFLAVATSKCTLCNEGGAKACETLLAELKDEEDVKVYLQAISADIEGNEDTVPYNLLNQYGLMDDRGFADIIVEEIRPICRKKLIKLLRGEENFSDGKLQRYWQDFYAGDDPSWGELIARSERIRGNPRYSIAEELVKMCIANNKLYELIAAMHKDRPDLMQGYHIFNGVENAP